MNRLRILKQRIRRAGDVGVLKLASGYVVATSRFQGSYVSCASKRQAIQVAAQWAKPSAPVVCLITDSTKQTKTICYPDGSYVSTVYRIDPSGEKVEIRPSQEWLDALCYSYKEDGFGFAILSPDGWDRTNFEASWSELIDRNTFIARLQSSTTLHPPLPPLEVAPSTESA